MNRISLAIALSSVLLLGCSSAQPRVVAVNTLIRQKTVPDGQARIFANDKATGDHFVVSELPPDQQRQEIFVRWAGEGIDAVTLEYRQPGLPQPAQQQFQATNNRTQGHLFVVGNEQFRRGGPVSAWRVTLWRAGQAVARKQSVLWQ